MEAIGIILILAVKEKLRPKAFKPFAQGPEWVDSWISDWGEHHSKEDRYKEEGEQCPHWRVSQSPRAEMPASRASPVICSEKGKQKQNVGTGGQVASSVHVGWAGFTEEKVQELQ